MVDALFLFVAGLLGGAVNSLAGGGSFIVFPALLFVGVPPVIANASNTYAALPGYASGAFGYWHAMSKYKDRLVIYTIIAAVFGYIGAELLLVVSDEQFSRVVPWLMLFAVMLFIFGNRLNAFVAARSGGRRGMKLAGTALLLAFLAGVCVYGGFFNAGLGILLLAFLATAGLSDIHAMNGLKLYVSSVVAVVAVARFSFSGSIDWYHGSIALVGVTIGGYLAARNAHRFPTQWIRAAVIVYGLFMTGYFFWNAYAA
ncbi:permease [Devosia epidermidihirudinis]|uniref:Probable membrane transporter protein n=1 Tax=Devosia epidermidihirudinis TaxID=1293439 RepID=A0A0F5QG03_9HYPH|nr:sulfite exporter TauE/SafE family protein [Devosia epidermidihirudinis]KKC39661.1 permease [Devosia epidermidihirudinis]